MAEPIVETGSDTADVQTGQVEAGATQSPDTGTATGDSKDTGAISEGDVDVSALTEALEAQKKANRAISHERSEAKKLADSERAEKESLQQKLDELLTRVPAPTKGNDDGFQDAGKLHPKLEGMKYDPQDRTVEIDGAWYPERIAMAVAHQEASVESQAQTAKEQEAQAEEQRLQEGWNALITAVSTDIDKTLTKLNPDLPEDHKSFASRTLQSEVTAKLKEQGVVIEDPYNPPEGFEKAVQKAIAAAYGEYRKMFGYKWAEQAAGNEETRQTHPAKPDAGQAGVQGEKLWHQMTKKEKADAMRAANK